MTEYPTCKDPCTTCEQQLGSCVDYESDDGRCMDDVAEDADGNFHHGCCFLSDKVKVLTNV